MAQIKIIAENNAGEEVASSAYVLADLPDKTGDERLEEMLRVYAEDGFTRGRSKWTATVANPDFDPSQPESAENAPTIPNPIPYAEAALQSTMDSVENEVVVGLKKRYEKALTAGVEQEIRERVRQNDREVTVRGEKRPQPRL